jgi:hypothetical protein
MEKSASDVAQSETSFMAVFPFNENIVQDTTVSRLVK